jgi:hypothetical protein
MNTAQTMEPPAITEWVPGPLYQMTVDQYETLVDSGAFTKRDRLHLINGLLVAKMTQGVSIARPTIFPGLLSRR